MKIHLIRHGEVHNPQGILYGRLPRFRLTETGYRQAERCGRFLERDGLDAIYSSPMLRARQTAKAIIGQLGSQKTHLSELLNEVHTAFEGQPGAIIDNRHGDIYTGCGQDYEQPRDIVRRTLKFIERLRRDPPGKRVAAVTHGDIIVFTVLWAKGADLVPLNKTRLIQVGYPESYPAHASITTLTYTTDAPEELPNLAYHRP